MSGVRSAARVRLSGALGRSWRLPLIMCVAACVVVGGLAACPRSDGWTGGLVTPSPVPVTFNPYAQPRGETVPTGIVIKGLELILYFWGSGEGLPDLDVAWRDVATGHVGDSTMFTARLGDSRIAQTGSGAPFRVNQMSFDGDDLLIEFGSLRGVASRITSADARTVTEARFTRWSEDPAVTIFWLRRRGLRIRGGGSSQKG